VLQPSRDRRAPTPITVSEVAQILQGASSIELFEPLDTGVWITVDIDTVPAIQQQYRPQTRRRASGG
jgi:hypothetical protein